MDLSASEARSLHLTAQGFGVPRTMGTTAKVKTLSRRLHAFQIDSVNVLVRAHYMPAYSRLGPYPRQTIDDLAYKRRELFEYWGHAACLMPTSLYPLFRWRMENQQNSRWWGEAKPAVKKYVESVYEHVAANGPVSAGELPNAGKSTGNWWGWSDGKRAIEVLFRLGRVLVSGRKNFARLYDLPERVIPKEFLRTDAPQADDAKKQLLVLAAKALGIGAASDIAGYFHIETWWDRTHVKGRYRSQLPRLMAELVEERRLEVAKVEGWQENAYVVPRTRSPKPVHARALVSPFDPIMWNRTPTQRLFGFDYKIEIYVPEAKRVYGYYSLPFLLGDRLVARVDLKADRKGGALLVPGAFAEKGVDLKAVGAELADELRLMASWLELDRIVVGERGDLVKPLHRALR